MSPRLPGLYREEIAALPSPRPAASGVPALLGYGPKTDGSAAFSSWAEFRQFQINNDTVFHPALPLDPLLCGAVKGFFDCGGQRCHVVLFPPSAVDPAAAWNEAVDALADLDEVDLVCAPSLMSAVAALDPVPVQARILEVCAARGDCFAILDTAGAAPPRPQLEALYHLVGDDERLRNGALYHPWIAVDGATLVPPCGHVAGVYARVGRRTGPHRAPANELLDGVVDLAIPVDDAVQFALNEGLPNMVVNCLRAFPGRGIRVWGARTLAQKEGSPWSSIGVRRLFIHVVRHLLRATAWAAFEPNDLRLWMRLDRQLQAYCIDLFQRGALRGASAPQAFYVKVDDENNPPAVRDAGQVVVEIGLAPAIPAEFIKVRLTQARSGATASVVG